MSARMRISSKLPGVTRRVVHGEVDGTPYRAHFEGRPNKETMDALEEIVRAVAKMTPEEIEAARERRYPNIAFDKEERP